MPTAAAGPVPPLNVAEMQVLVARAGLVLNPGQLADLVLVWRQLAGLAASLPRERPMADDQAFAFRLPSPVSAPSPRQARKKPAARSAPAGKNAAEDSVSLASGAVKPAPAPGVRRGRKAGAVPAGPVSRPKPTRRS
ncbi:MAG: hypothetical protein KGL52_10315 [Rhodospirillales bacterium]|nr:hypothetical protein [Rhodospirillales bacterium]